MGEPAPGRCASLGAESRAAWNGRSFSSSEPRLTCHLPAVACNAKPFVFSCLRMFSGTAAAHDPSRGRPAMQSFASCSSCTNWPRLRSGTAAASDRSLQAGLKSGPLTCEPGTCRIREPAPRARNRRPRSAEARTVRRTFRLAPATLGREHLRGRACNVRDARCRNCAAGH